MTTSKIILPRYLLFNCNYVNGYFIQINFHTPITKTSGAFILSWFAQVITVITSEVNL